MLTNVDIEKAITTAMQARSERTRIGADWVLRQAVKVYEQCMQVVPVMIRNGDTWVLSGEYKFDACNALRALELVGKHNTINCFNDKPSKITNKGNGQMVVQIISSKKQAEALEKSDTQR